MALIQFMSLAFGAVMLVGAILAAVAVLRMPRLRTRDAAFLLSVACIVGGVFVASVATPDWSPITMGALYLPFLCIGIWMGFVASLRGRKGDAAPSSGEVSEHQEESSRQWAWLLVVWAALAAVPVLFISAMLLWDAIILNLFEFGSGL